MCADNVIKAKLGVLAFIIFIRAAIVVYGMRPTHMRKARRCAGFARSKHDASRLDERVKLVRIVVYCWRVRGAWQG